MFTIMFWLRVGGMDGWMDGGFDLSKVLLAAGGRGVDTLHINTIQNSAVRVLLHVSFVLSHVV